MHTITKLMSVLALVAASTAAQASTIATATIDGGSFLQSGSVLNTAGSSANITSVVFSLGTAADGIATWDSNGGSTAGGAGAVTSDFLSDPRWFQTVTWGGLSIAPGASFNFGSLDIDLISTLVPLNIDQGTIDNAGTSLANAFMTISWSDGSSATTSLYQTGWQTTQNLRFVGQVPEPASLALLSLGLLGLSAVRRRAGR